MWFLLFDGSSPDGLGTPKYKGRTGDPLTAMEHLSKVANDGYSTGEVRAYNHNEEQYYRTISDMSRLISFVRHTEEYEEKNK